MEVSLSLHSFSVLHRNYVFFLEKGRFYLTNTKISVSFFQSSNRGAALYIVLSDKQQCVFSWYNTDLQKLFHTCPGS